MSPDLPCSLGNQRRTTAMSIATSEYIELSRTTRTMCILPEQNAHLCVFAEGRVRVVAAAWQILNELVLVRIGQNRLHHT